MVRSLSLVLLLSFAFSLTATTRYVTDRAAGPVRWLEWGKPAFERAKKEKRPLFVSIGFAASWDCHRMHREAFLHGENAEALNAYFVPVLLDRIEYPDAAEAYEALQSGQGWPVNLILTPDLEPFAGARFMTTAELNRMLVINANRWAHERAAVIAEAKANIAKAKPAGEPTSIRNLPPDALRALAAGPRRDQLGGGFHRCDTCFEKILSDQALYARAYLDAWQVTRDPDFAHVARTTLDAALRDLVPPLAQPSPPSGGEGRVRGEQRLIQSAQDAHSLVPGQGPEFAEGAFYVWTRDEITRLLGHEDAAKVFKLYALKDGERLVLEDPRFLHETYDELAAPLQKLLEVRQKRPAPFREVGVTGWNGLMISALARGAAVLDERKYLDAATSAATLIATRLWDAKKKTLYRTETKTAALGEDYAMLVQGLLDLFDSGHDVKWLELAITLQQRQDELFHETNAIAAMNLLRLGALTGNETWRSRSGIDTVPSIIVVIGDARAPETRDALRAIYDRWEPMRSVVFVPRKGAVRDRMVKTLPFVGALAADPERTVTYICANGVCSRR
ncbi:MAG TPA: DUF255 domain-containing protein [Thermoanaerobaculia bacterium]|nr:DUF255 domain-containing protein [Thermoanaerobaculia bacterium]